MIEIETRDQLRAFRARAKEEHRRVALVPTMGALHEGHLSLIERAATLADWVVVSIYVNPTQFGPSEDFDRYPRRNADDLELLSAHGYATHVFVPDDAVIYPNGVIHQRAWVDLPEMASVLCGAHRPGHFSGVATVVLKLLNLIQPDVAVFGLKDAQQFLILRQMVSDLCLSVDLDGAPISRESSGLARSSRNELLSPSARRHAAGIYEALAQTRSLMEEGEGRIAVLEAQLWEGLSMVPGVRVEYAEIRITGDLSHPTIVYDNTEYLVAVACHLEGVRLIDNFIWSRKS